MADPTASLPRRGLQLWLAADGELRLEGTTVKQWNDQSGRANHAIRFATAAASAGPTLVELPGGKAVLRFDGSEVSLAWKRIPNIRTVFWVLSKDPKSFGQRNERFVFGDIAFGLLYNADFHPGSHTRGFLLHGNTSAAFLREGQVRLDGKLVDGTTTDFPKQLGVVSMVSTGNVTASRLSFDRGYEGRAWQGDVAEVLVYDRVLGDAERARVEEHLFRKYGIAGKSEAAPPSPAWSAAAATSNPTPPERYGPLPVLALAFSPDGKTLVSGHDTVKTWDAQTLRPLRTFEGTPAPTTHKNVAVGRLGQFTRLAFTPDGKHLLAAATDGLLRQWTSDGRPVPLTGALARPGLALWGLSISADGKTVAIGVRNDGDDVRRFRHPGGEPAAAVETPPGGWHGRLWTTAHSRDGKRLAASAEDRSLRIWNAATGALENVIDAGSVVWSFAFSPDGKTLAAACVNMTLQLWDAETGELSRTLAGHGAGLTAVAYSPDGKLIATASDDATVRLWQAASGRVVRTLVGHAVAAWSVAFSRDGKTLVSGGGDGTIKAWNVATGRLLKTVALRPE